jgi:hypothetical protein
MFELSAYPYPTYIPNKIAAGCLAGIVSTSLIAWVIQSCQIRFRPPRLNCLLLISHLTILTELIVRVAVSAEEQNSKNVFIAINSLFAIGQRMIIVGNFLFVMEIHHEKSWLSRGIVIGAVLCVVSSGLLMAPANIYSFDPDQTNKSFLFRELSAAVLLVVTVLFYPVWYWSKTLKDMTRQGIILISISSIMCVTVAIFNLIESLSNYYSTINDNEVWFYIFQISPIILAHITWSILHPKRTLAATRAGDRKSIIEEEYVNKAWSEA